MIDAASNLFVVIIVLGGENAISSGVSIHYVNLP